MRRKRKNFLKILTNIFIYSSLSLDYKESGDFFSFQTTLSIFSPTKQLYFYFFNLNLSFNLLFSSGAFLKEHFRSFKFFKKSTTNFNPLLLAFKYRYSDELQYLYCLSVKNFFKKHYIFLKKFFLYIRAAIKYLLLTKS
jgi:hypothetical protein